MMKLFRSMFFYVLAAYVGWSGIQYANNTTVRFPDSPYMMLANLEPFAGEEEPDCKVLDINGNQISDVENCSMITSDTITRPDEQIAYKTSVDGF